MALYLDSAQIDQAVQAQSLGFVAGITTNPKLISQTGEPSLDVLEKLVNFFDGHVFYQLTATSLEARIDEAWQAYDLRPDRVVIILPATTQNLGFIKRVSEIEVAITAVYSPLQAYAAAEAGAQYVIPYVHRASQSISDGLTLVSQIARLLEPYPTEIMADSIETLEQALDVLEAGANHLTLPFELLSTIGDHPLSNREILEWRNE